MRKPQRCVFVVCARFVPTDTPLCAASSCHEILRVATAARAGWLRDAGRLGFFLLFSGVFFVLGKADRRALRRVWTVPARPTERRRRPSTPRGDSGW